MFYHVLQREKYKQVYLGNGALSGYDGRLKECAENPNLRSRVTLIGYNAPSVRHDVRLRTKLDDWNKSFLIVDGLSKGNACVVEDIYDVPHAIVMCNQKGQRVDCALRHSRAEFNSVKHQSLCFKYVLNGKCPAGESCRFLPLRQRDVWREGCAQKSSPSHALSVWF